MFRFLKLFVLAFAAVLGAAACTGKGANAPVPEPETTVLVENQAWLDVNVYAVSGGGGRIRLGTVTANSSRSLRIPQGVVGIGQNLQFFVDPIGSNNTGTSYNIFVRAGERVRLTVPPTFGR